MGIQFLSSQTKSRIGVNESGKAMSESEFVDAFSLKTGLILSGSSGRYTVNGVKEIDKDDNYNLYLPTSSPVNNFVLSSQRGYLESLTEDDDYYYLRRYVTIYFNHTKDEEQYESDVFYAIAGKIIYLRKNLNDSCCKRVLTDGYSGSETIAIQFVFLQKEEKQEEEEEQPVPINPVVPSDFGAFPNGIGADYCWLVCKTDESYRNTLDADLLNQMANDYVQKIDDTAQEKTYYSRDEQGIFVLVQKDSADDSAELNNDWTSLYGNTPFNLENEIVHYEKDGQIIDCYKIYINGQCQLMEFDGTSFVEDQGGTTDVPEYNLPNGYYIIVGKKLRLFLLTTIDAAEYPYDTNKILFNENSNIGQGIQNVDSRYGYNNNRYYTYAGHKTRYITDGITADNVIFAELSNLRKVTLSDTITTVGHFGGNANPDNGFYFPKYLKSIGPLTITYTAGTSVYIYSSYLENISDNAFYDGTSVDTNMRLFIGENPIEMEIEHPTGYIKPSNALKSIGNNAFYGLKPTGIDLTNCIYLNYVGRQALAVDAACKYFKFLYAQLSQREEVENKQLIYLPDEIISRINETPPIGANASTYSSSEKMTLGTYINGYSIDLK